MLGLNHVEPGGAPLLVPLSGSVTMIKVSVGPGDNNAYILQRSGGDTLLIDAANDDDRLLKIIADQPLDTIVTTHRHADHWQLCRLLPCHPSPVDLRPTRSGGDQHGRLGRGHDRSLGR